MSKKEVLLYRLTELMFEKQQTFLLLDELYEDGIISPFVRNIQIDSPYQQLLFDGVLSQYNHQNEIVVSFTIEAYFHHLLAKVLQKDERYQSAESLLKLIQNNYLPGLKDGVSNLFSLDIEKRIFKRIIEFIDLNKSRSSHLDMCISPIINSFKVIGIKVTLSKILNNNSDNDWLLLNDIIDEMDKLTFFDLKENLLKETVNYNKFETKNQVIIGLKYTLILKSKKRISYFNNIKDKITWYDHNVNNLIAEIERSLNNFDSSLSYYKKSLIHNLKTLGNYKLDLCCTYDNIGDLYIVQALYNKALNCFFKSLDIKKENNLALSSSYTRIAHIYRFKGNIKQAIYYHNKALEISLKEFGSHHENSGTDYFNLAQLFSDYNKLDKALIYFEKSITIHLKCLGANSIKVSDVYNDLGLVYSKLANYNDSLKYHKKSLSIKLKYFGEKSTESALSYNNIGAVYYYQKNLDKALNYYESALEIQKKYFVKFHPDIAMSYNNIAHVFFKQEKYAQALEFYKKAYSILLKSNGFYHLNVEKVVNSIANIEELKSNYFEALNYQKKRVKILKRIFGFNNYKLNYVYEKIGYLLEHISEYNQSIIYFKKKSKIIIYNGEDFVTLSNIFKKIAEIYCELSQPKNELKYYKKALNCEFKNKEYNYYNISDLYNLIGVTYYYSNKFKLAIKYFQISLDYRINFIGNEIEDVQNVYNNIASSLEKLLAFDKAIKFHSQRLQLLQINYKSNITLISEVYFSIGVCNFEQNFYDKALLNFNKGFEIKKTGGFSYKIAQCYEALNDQENALDFYIQSAEIRKEDPEFGLEAESTLESINNAKRLAKKLKKESKLPEWIKNLN